MSEIEIDYAMARYYFDSSAFVKFYHVEVGTPEVESRILHPASEPLISRLAITESISAFATRCRTGEIGEQVFLRYRRKLLTDISYRHHGLSLARVHGGHFQHADTLIRDYGPRDGLRALDALQLAVAMDLHAQLSLDEFVVPIQFSTPSHAKLDCLYTIR